MEFQATCPTGFEQLLATELKDLGEERVRPLTGRVSFEGGLEAGYRACLWSRLASRVICVLTRGPATDTDSLYETASTIAWEDHLDPRATFAVNASGVNDRLKDSRFTAMRITDAVRDRMLARRGVRPQTNPKSPDLSIVATLSDKRVSIGIDLAGAPLTRRGYERQTPLRGLRTDYAMALLMIGGWDRACEGTAPVLVDASTAPSSLVVEAALFAARRAPGLLRVRWGFSGWALHDAALWDRLVAQARSEAADEAPAILRTPLWRDGQARQVRSILRAAGIAATITCTLGEDEEVDLVTCDFTDTGDDLPREAHLLGRLSGMILGCQPKLVACAATDGLVDMTLGREALTRIETQLGRDACTLSAYDGQGQGEGTHTVEVSPGNEVSVLVSASDQFCARLRKVAKQRAQWAEAEDVSCYRVYDADLPDYNLSIELYQGLDPRTQQTSDRKWLWVSEYAPPKDVDVTLARSRLLDALSLAPEILGVDPAYCYLRVRRHAKGGSQYADEGAKGTGARKGPGGLPAGAHLIDEGGLTFEVNFSTRLDCGIFLDHRDTRAMIREMAKQTKGSKRFLNLFAYTGTATCYAADGGCLHTTTVDMSRPSLDWARRNMERNGFTGPAHEYVQADVIRFVEEQRHSKNRWDLIFCDVPTFSNSSRMGKRSFDVQRDHAELLIGVSRLLMRDGCCVFSCNLRSFEPDVDKLARAGVSITDITDKTIPADFDRNTRIHHTYLVKRSTQPPAQHKGGRSERRTDARGAGRTDRTHGRGTRGRSGKGQKRPATSRTSAHGDRTARSGPQNRPNNTSQRDPKKPE